MADEATPTARDTTTVRHVAFITLVFFLTHGLSLLNRGIFWDDWVFWQQDPSVVSTVAAQMGSTWPAAINRLFFYSSGGIFFGRLVTFGAMLLSAVLFYDILRRLAVVSETTAFWGAVLFAVFPVYECRIALVLIGYALSVAMFTTALWLLVRTARKPTIPVRVLAAVLFLMSFRTGSLLFFFAVVPAVLLLADPPVPFTFGGAFKRLAGYADQMMLPILYWVVTRISLEPFGLYAGYNEPAESEFFHSLFHALANIAMGPFLKAQNASTIGAPLLVVALVAALVFVASRRWPQVAEKRNLQLFAAGVVVLLFGVLPYVIVGKMPGNWGWEMRHQLLVPFGGTLLVIALVNAISAKVRPAIGAAVLALVIAASVAVHVDAYVDYQRDWLKQQALMTEFEQSDAIRDARYILFEDETRSMDAGRREYYEYAGMLTEVYGDQSRFGIFAAYYLHDVLPEHNLARQPYYKLADFHGGAPDLWVRVTRGEVNLSKSATVLRLMFLEWTDPARFEAEIDEALVFETRPYDPYE